MAKVKDINTLKEIAKRFAKGCLIDAADFAFMGTGLSEDQQHFINEYLNVIGDRITKLDAALDVVDLVDEYYE